MFQVVQRVRPCWVAIMRCGSRLGLFALSMTVVLTLTHWSWLQVGRGRNYRANMVMHSYYVPTSIRAKQKMLQQIEAPPAPAELAVAGMLTLLSRPAVFDREPGEPPPAPLAMSDPLYGFMSLQV